jgi:hypothetical protein
MNSKGGKRRYHCSECKSNKIEKVIAVGQESFHCEDCLYFGPWSERLNLSPAESVSLLLTLASKYNYHDPDLHPFDPDNYEKELYIVFLKDGTQTIGYPNAGRMTDMKKRLGDITDRIEKCKIHPDGWEAMT